MIVTECLNIKKKKKQIGNWSLFQSGYHIKLKIHKNKNKNKKN